MLATTLACPSYIHRVPIEMKGLYLFKKLLSKKNIEFR